MGKIHQGPGGTYLPGGKSLEMFLLPPPDCVCPEGPAKLFPGVPPSVVRRALGGDPGQAGGLGG